jgi:hypothetical protein
LTPRCGENVFCLVCAYLAADSPSESGDWAGSVWSASGVPGQEESCAQRTGFSSCEAFVRASGSSFTQACKSWAAPFLHSILIPRQTGKLSASRCTNFRARGDTGYYRGIVSWM